MWLHLSKFFGYLLSPLSVVLGLALLALLLRLFGKRGGAALCALTAGVLLTVSSLPKLSSALILSLQNQYPAVEIAELPEARVIVLLGGSVAMPIAPRKAIELHESSDRVLHAARLFKAGKGELVFVTGGNLQRRGDEKPEAYYVTRLLTEWGVPRYRIALGDQSRTTRENALETRKYLAGRGWLDQPVLLVTSATHMPRSVATFENAGIDVIPATTDVAAWSPLAPTFMDWLPSIGALAGVSKAWREYLGLWYYQLRGWAE